MTGYLQLSLPISLSTIVYLYLHGPSIPSIVTTVSSIDTTCIPWDPAQIHTQLHFMGPSLPGSASDAIVGGAGEHCRLPGRTEPLTMSRDRAAAPCPSAVIWHK